MHHLYYHFVHHHQVAGPLVAAGDWERGIGLAVTAILVTRPSQKQVIAIWIKGYSVHLVVDVPKSKRVETCVIK